MKVNKLLASAFAFVVVSSLIFPASAQVRDADENRQYSPAELAELVQPTSHGNVIYQNGNLDPSNEEFFDDRILADDFVLISDNTVTDAHFAADLGTSFNPLLDPLLYFIFDDNGGVPGNVIASGTAQKTQSMVLGGGENDDIFEFWFDFEDPVPLDGGVTYWFGLKYTEEFAEIDPEPLWQSSDVITGNVGVECEDCDIPPDTNDWSTESFDFWFQLTGDKEVVGGEFLPIDTTALVLAGLQTSAIWMLPVLAGVAGSAFGVLYIKSRRN